MKTGILSMQRVDNMGSLLQAYALKKILEKLGMDVSFIDIEPRSRDHSTIVDAIYDYRKESDRGKHIDRYFFYRLANKIQCQKQKKLYEQFRKEELGISSYDSGENVDCCVIGSDEVFNCLSPSPWGFTSQLFGNITNVHRIITYAASCGATQYEDLPEDTKKIIQEAFTHVTAFSGRDQNTIDFIRRFGVNEAIRHLDPVLVYSFQKEASDYSSIVDKLPEKYCILYSYQNRIHKPEEIKAIKDFCKKNDFSLISIGQSQYWLPHHYVMHPFSAIAAFKNAEYVITDTFHGCILASKYTKDFSVLIRKSNENKLKDLVKTIDIEKYLIKEMIDLKIHASNDKSGINDILSQEQTRTEDYLRIAL